MQTKPKYGTHLFLLVMSAMWLLPLLWTLYTALRPKEITDKYGYFSFQGPITFTNFTDAWTQGNLPTYFVNSIYMAVPAVLLTLVFASMMAFAVSRFTWRFNITLL